MKLKNLRKMFEKKTRGGYEFKILEIGKSEIWPIVIVYKNVDKWNVDSVKFPSGLAIHNQENAHDLIPIKQELIFAEERGYIKGKQYEKERMIELLGLTK